MFSELGLRDCYLFKTKFVEDARGAFAKPFDLCQLRAHGHQFEVAETFLSWSKRDVIRGLHFQIPPNDHKKIVSCLKGRILDVLVDLRPRSATYLRVDSVELSGEQPLALYLPPGIAHGFCSLQDDSLVGYWVSSVHSPEHDQGILWNSIDFVWPVNRPILSPRDVAFPPISEYHSPF